MESINANKLTPMMQQYIKIKRDNMDKILFYRLGDFYEMFFDDAIIASKELEIALTARESGLDKKAPMCGVPHHSASVYINKLVSRGYKIAIVEQTEDPNLSKGLVERNIVKIISPGMILDLDGKEKDNNFLASLYYSSDSAGISYIDISTGEFNTTEIINSSNLERDILDFISKINPREIVSNKNIEFNTINNLIENNNIYISYFGNENLDIKYSKDNISKKVKNFDLKNFKDKFFSIISSSLLLDYIYIYRDSNLDHIDKLNYIENNKFLKIDANTRNNLEIHKNLNDATRKNTLLNVLDVASTPMGSRKINSWLEFPLINKNDINYRLTNVEYLVNNLDLSSDIEEVLNNVYDLERILSKVSYQNANIKDLLNLKYSIRRLPEFKQILTNSTNPVFIKIGTIFDELSDIYKIIDDSIDEDSKNQITEGNIIKNGYNEILDNLKKNSILGSKKLIQYEADEKKRTGISKLKISFNKNVGHYIEITNSSLSNVPDNYIRRQTLKNVERFITKELNEISDMILGSSAETAELEYKIFNEIRDSISKSSTRIKETTEIISTIDALNSFAKVSVKYNYNRPTFNEKGYIHVINGRHPVIEKNNGLDQFIPNDTVIGKDNKTFQILTGPNMSGKSTYMRQVALILLMAQIGCYVPADTADISISDAIFTRIGASDNLAKGDSTFMVEMKEMSNIITNATKNSFVILDEVGRGTSTYDGYSIAKAIVEYISKNINCKTLFATHYHELTDLENYLNNVENLKVEIHEDNNNIAFLRKIVKGKTDKSYGIEVAKLSGLPEEILFRANSILQSLDKNVLSENKQLSFTLEEEDNNKIKKDILIKELKSIDINNLTPIAAFELLNKFNNKAKDITND